MDLKEAEALCNHWLPLWTGNQPEKLAACYAEDVFYRDPAKPDGIHGNAALLAYLRKLCGKFPDWVWRHEEIWPIEGGFTLKWSATIPLGDRAITEKGLDIVLVQGGLITRNEVYFDRAQMLG